MSDNTNEIEAIESKIAARREMGFRSGDQELHSLELAVRRLRDADNAAAKKRRDETLEDGDIPAFVDRMMENR